MYTIAVSEQSVALAHRLLGRAPDLVTPLSPPAGGDDSRAFAIESGRQRLFLKIAKKPGLPLGVYFHGRLKEAGIPVPELIAFDPSAGPAGEACALWEWIDGRPAQWGNGAQCPYDEAQLGEVLRRIHDLEFEGPYGFLGDAPSAEAAAPCPDLGPTSKTWAGFFNCERAARRLADSGCLSPPEAGALAALPERLGNELNQAERRLLHMGDVMFNGNLILDPLSGRIRAVVNYAESMAGDPAWELARFDYYFRRYPLGRREFNLDRFWSAYGENERVSGRLADFYFLAMLVFEKTPLFERGSMQARWAQSAVRTALRRLGQA